MDRHQSSAPRALRGLTAAALFAGSTGCELYGQAHLGTPHRAVLFAGADLLPFLVGAVIAAVAALGLVAWAYPGVRRWRVRIAAVGCTLLLAVSLVFMVGVLGRARFRFEYDVQALAMRVYGEETRTARWDRVTHLRIEARTPWLHGLPLPYPMELKVLAFRNGLQGPPLLRVPLAFLSPAVREDLFRIAYLRGLDVTEVPPAPLF